MAGIYRTTQVRIHCSFLSTIKDLAGSSLYLFDSKRYRGGVQARVNTFAVTRQQSPEAPISIRGKHGTFETGEAWALELKIVSIRCLAKETNFHTAFRIPAVPHAVGSARLAA